MTSGERFSMGDRPLGDGADVQLLLAQRRDNADQFASYLDNLPDALRSAIGELSLGTPVGYLQSELFSFLGPASILVFAIGAGARSLAGEEEQGRWTSSSSLRSPEGRSSCRSSPRWP